MEIYKSEMEVSKYITREVPKHVLEMEFIIKFLKDLPIDKLKKLINFKEIDFENKELIKESRQNKELFDLLTRLNYKNQILFKCKIEI